MICYLGIAVLAAYVSTSAALPPCVCTRELNLLCGTDGVTYNNECLLRCARARNKPALEVARRGSCNAQSPSSCICPLIYSPVCGSDGQTYSNACSLKCKANILKMHNGACKNKRDTVKVAKLEPCVCTRERKPVCGTDGHTYSNPCMFNCAKSVYNNLNIDHVGQCAKIQVPKIEQKGVPSCTCTRNYDPVCGSDGETYANECMMKCAGAELSVDRRGPCDGPILTALDAETL